METTISPVGPLLRTWRERRHFSQLDLSIEAGVSSRHLSFVETGRAKPSRSMVLQLAATLDVPKREQNQLLVAAGFAPAYAERPLEDPEMGVFRAGLDRLLAAYEPFPCLVVDRGWNMVMANAGVTPLLEGVAPHLLDAPNALRLSLHPEGLAPRILNLAEWRAHVLGRLAREVATSGSDGLRALYDELLDYPGGLDPTVDDRGVAVTVVIDSPAGQLSFLSTVTTFGTALDLTAAELSIEAFLPADDQTAKALQC
ncbi:transcriptional regulator with XRE-family HTH domain [Aeromicrobium panaciterrae]|uniref:Transcriptional regulator with XRE-family HTH domain n=1 Tax=Aeromicrobium panaciterrae TaxID=363861 RepID=A0ABU1URS3_9ACTN|nr:helix-turn-helix transcriptional regulator [Aeromicrobium panaciterrae]MDR7087872.1 transcriptional regulator with XRE-family HTH domain [Aeromicrobium panaciterrae]